MKIARIAYHGLALTMIDMACILLGFGVWALVRRGGAQVSQLLVQGTTAGFLILTAVAFWIELFPLVRWKAMTLRDRLEYLLLLPVSMAWFLVIFYPLHFLTQRYLASFTNILAVWAFQLPVNGLALWAAYSNAKTSGFLHAPEAETGAAQSRTTP